MSLSTVDLSATDRDLLKKIILLLEAQLRGSTIVKPFTAVDGAVVTTT